MVPLYTSPGFVVCNPPVGPKDEDARLPVTLWDSSSLTVARSRITYSYPTKAEIYNITGCLGSDYDSTKKKFLIVQGCPTVGGFALTVTGKRFRPDDQNFKARFRDISCTVRNSTALLLATNRTQFVCNMPEGSGERLPLTLDSGGYQVTFGDGTALNGNAPYYALSYELPTISTISGCNQYGKVNSTTCPNSIQGGSCFLQDCRRPLSERETITIRGKDFGPKKGRVLIGATPCVDISSWTQSAIVCQLPPGQAKSQQIIVLQSTGGMLIEETLTVSYEQCSSGYYDPSLARNAAPGQPCKECLPGYYADKTSSTTCTVCAPGTFSPTSGASVCQQAEPGTYQQANNRFNCSAGKYTDRFAQTECSTCQLGRFTANVGSSSCLDCPAGRFAAPNSTTSCLDCAPGQITPLPVSQLYILCKANSYNPQLGKSACHLCPPNAEAPDGAAACACRSTVRT